MSDMKKVSYLGVGLLLSLSAALFTGCEEKPSETPSSADDGVEVVRGGIEGVVKDRAKDSVISQALLELLPTDKKTRTDAKGSFSFPDLKPGTYQLRVSKSGYAPYTVDSLGVKNGRTLVLSVLLSSAGSPDPDPDPNPAPAPEPGPVGSDYVERSFGMSLKMVAVEGGTFSMGATEEQGSDAYPYERPVHSVTLDGFYIGAFEVTQGQWAAVMGTNPCSGSSYGVGDNYPVYYVSWNEAVAFCEKLSQQTGKTYRLPTEAEWEYAARGGQQADGTKYAGSNNIGDVAWYYDNSYGLGEAHPDYGTHPVGQKKPNGLGIYDMSGNVWEWCSDWYGENYYSSSPSVNPQGPSSGSVRVLRGGGWGDFALYCRVSLRGSYAPDSQLGVGFRVVCER